MWAKHNTKKEWLAEKIIEYKQTTVDLQTQLDETNDNMNMMKTAYEEIINTLKRDIQKVNESWWEKLSDTQLGREKDVAEIEATLANE